MKYRVKRHTVVQPLHKPYRLIPLTRNLNAIVDTTDFDWLSKWNWKADWNPPTQSFYAVRREGDHKTILMHRAILGCKSGEFSDHISHKTLDNRRANLRKASRSQNNQNVQKHTKTVSGFKGVSWQARGLKHWVARIQVSGASKYLGHFDSPEAAAYAYDKAAKEHFGEFAHVNGVPPSSG